MGKKLTRGSAIIAIALALTAFLAGPASAKPGNGNANVVASWGEASWVEIDGSAV